MEMISKSQKHSQKEDDIPTGTSPTEHGFISDEFDSNQINEEELRKEMQQLGMADKNEGQLILLWLLLVFFNINIIFIVFFAWAHVLISHLNVHVTQYGILPFFKVQMFL